jgi:hypothetical protein
VYRVSYSPNPSSAVRRDRGAERCAHSVVTVAGLAADSSAAVFVLGTAKGLASAAGSTSRSPQAERRSARSAPATARKTRPRTPRAAPRGPGRPATQTTLASTKRRAITRVGPPRDRHNPCDPEQTRVTRQCSPAHRSAIHLPEAMTIRRAPPRERAPDCRHGTPEHQQRAQHAEPPTGSAPTRPPPPPRTPAIPPRPHPRTAPVPQNPAPRDATRPDPQASPHQRGRTHTPAEPSRQKRRPHRSRHPTPAGSELQPTTAVLAASRPPAPPTSPPPRSRADHQTNPGSCSQATSHQPPGPANGPAA